MSMPAADLSHTSKVDGTDNYDIARRLGIASNAEILLYAPIGADDFTRITSPDKLASLAVGTDVVVSGFVAFAPTIDSTKRMAKIALTNGSTTINFTAFGDLWRWRLLQKQQSITVHGKVDFWNGFATIKNATQIFPDSAGKLIPRYTEAHVGKPDEVNQAQIRRLMKLALNNHLSETVNFILERFALTSNRSREDASFVLAQQAGLIPLGFTSVEALLEALHSPSKKNDPHASARFAAARTGAQRLSAFLQIVRAQSHRNRSAHPNSVVEIAQAEIQMLVESVQATITKGRMLSAEQVSTISSIAGDLRADAPMDRLINGDVGAGKTIAFLIPAIAVQRSGGAVAILAPNASLAEQIAQQLSALNADVQLITGNCRRPPTTTNPILVGTTALIGYWQRNAQHFGSTHPHLLIVDEQQKFSTQQRDALLGPFTNRIEASATPMPRSLALANYGGRAISIIAKSPVEKRIISRLFPSPESSSVSRYNELRGKLFEFIRTNVGPQCQAMFLYPAKNDDAISLNGQSKALTAVRQCLRYLVNLNTDDCPTAMLRDVVSSTQAALGDAVESGRLPKFALPYLHRALMAPTLFADVAFEWSPAVNWAVKSMSERRLSGLPSTPSASDAEIVRQCSSATRDVYAAAELLERHFPGQVALLSGDQTGETRTRTMTEFKEGKRNILVCTTIAEVGLDIPGLRIGVVVDPENYGVSQLHQIRGRLARQGGSGMFVMLPRRDLDPETEKRLANVASTNNGFELAELDMRLRGIGNLGRGSGLQHGADKPLFIAVKAGAADLDELITRDI